mgnify:CR=1 FL=1
MNQASPVINMLNYCTMNGNIWKIPLLWSLYTKTISTYSNDEDAKWETALKSKKSCFKNEKAHLEGKQEAHFGAKYLNLMWLFTLLSEKIRVLNCTGYLLCIHLWGQTATEQIQLGHSLFQSDWCYYKFPSNFPCSGPDDNISQ